jgi:hypothetical protein
MRDFFAAAAAAACHFLRRQFSPFFKLLLIVKSGHVCPIKLFFIFTNFC